MRSIGMGVHRSFAQVVILEGGKTTQIRIDLDHDAVVAFGQALRSDDEVVREATGNTAAIVRLLTPFVARVVIANPLQVSRMRKLMSIAGINVAVATAVIAAIGDISRFSAPDRLASYFGLAPRIRQSGDRGAIHARISKQGNMDLSRFRSGRVLMLSGLLFEGHG